MNAGTHVLKLQFDNETEYNMSSIEFVKTGTIESVSFEALNGKIGIDEKSVELVVNQSLLASSLNGSLDQFSMLVNGVSQPITSVTMDGSKDRTIILKIEKNLIYTDQINVSYSGNCNKFFETGNNVVNIFKFNDKKHASNP